MTGATSSLHTLLRSIRPPFLLLTLVCIFLGYSAAVQAVTYIDYFQLWMVIVAGTAAHICVNALNEYLDFRSGLDAYTIKTPFSGGSGALVENPRAAPAVFYVAVAALSSLAFSGIYLCYRHGLQLLPLGLLGILIILSYTPWLNRQPLLCLIAERDDVIPPEHGERLFAAWGGPKRKILLEDAGHNTTDAHPLFWPPIREMLAQRTS
mgnify:CR=1 FL=1